MPEPITTIGAGAIAAYLSKDGLQKLLGPTAEYLGDGLRNFTQKRFDTIGRIFQSASEKLGEEINETGSVPPKVLKQVVDDGSFADDPIEIDYLGGVVASSRSAISRDNRGASISKLIDSLSNYQLRAHYLVYASARHVFAGSGLRFSPTDRQKMKLLLPLESFIAAMDFSAAELKQAQNIFTHIFFGLAKADLIEQEWFFGQPSDIKLLAPNADVAGIVCQPSSPGVELFLWAFGRGRDRLEAIYTGNFEPKVDGLPPFVAGAVAVDTM